MIINATTGTGFGGALLYVNKENVDLTKETKPEVLELNHVFGTPREQAIQMRFVAKENSRSSRPVLHLSVSFSLEEKLEHKKVDEVLKQVVREFGATPDNNQYAIVKHNDAGHEHYHIVLNKVGFNGKNIDTSYVQNKAHIVADKIEQQQGLKPTEGRRILYDPSNEKGYRYATKEELAKYKPSKKVFKDKKPSVKKAKEEIQSKVIDILQYAKSPKEFKAELAAQGVDVRYSEDRENGNEIRGASFRTDKISVKGGDVGFKWNEISKILEANLSQAKNKEASMDTTVESNKEPLLKEEIISKMKIYLRENPDKIPHAVNLADQAVRIFMEELDPKKNRWLTWIKHSDHEERYNELYQYAENSIKHQREESKTDKLTKPIPTAKEQREIDFVVKLREALQNVTKAINHHVNAGQLKCVKPILEHYGFRETEKGLLFKDLYFSNTIKTTRFEETQNNILKSFSTHQAEVKEYAELMATKPINISLIWDNLNGNRKEKEASNNLLAKQQKAAVKPVFKMVIAPPLGNFKPKTKFDTRMEEFNKAQAEIAKKTEKIVLAPERSQYKMRR